MAGAVEEATAQEPLAFHFGAGRLCIDFANTGGEMGGVACEDVRTPADLARWLAESEPASPGVAVTPAELLAARALRDAIWRSAARVMRGQPLLAEDVALINEGAARPALAPQLDAATGRMAWRAPLLVSAALGTIARDAVDLFSGPWVGRIRECANPNCILFFVDTSRPGKRRWCTMSRCGNRAKTASYRRRRAGAR